MSTNRKLGRGLDSLLQGGRSRVAPSGDAAATPRAIPAVDEPQTQLPDPPAPAAARLAADELLETELAGGSRVLAIAPRDIQPNPFQPRLSFDRNELEALKLSISREGILQPLLVRRGPNSGYQLVAGERRLRAAQDLGLATVPAVVAEVGDEKLLELALIENIHRENLNPVDTALAFKRLLELRSWTQDILAQSLGLSRPSVSNTLRLLELPEPIQRALSRGQIQIGHAKVLLSISEPLSQMRLFERIAEDRLSVRDLEQARDSAGPASEATSDPKAARKHSARPRDKSADTQNLERQLSEALSTRVTILEKKGKGSIRIEFYGAEDFQTLQRALLAAARKA